MNFYTNTQRHIKKVNYYKYIKPLKRLKDKIDLRSHTKISNTMTVNWLKSVCIKIEWDTKLLNRKYKIK